LRDLVARRQPPRLVKIGYTLSSDDHSPGELLEMLEEAIEVMRLLWQGGAHVYDLPEEPSKILVSGFGPKATSLAARVGDGYVTTSPDKELIGQFRAEHGKGPVHAGAKVCFGPDRDEAVKTVHRLWPNIGPNLNPFFDTWAPHILERLGG
jgi:alkanesulfonate monooxygenase SsuD/methylene tetrahydromethanopterin reductase-like flavin-dependent oxidoreductase (luciferase family)